jgi:hypothetical protein
MAWEMPREIKVKKLPVGVSTTGSFFEGRQEWGYL